ncbi:MAG: secretion protein HlyD [Gammaproteobacteria bacterium]|nr:MAG: secretion protein HlyD [Gammaproteobacteria bacterium]
MPKLSVIAHTKILPVVIIAGVALAIALMFVFKPVPEKKKTSQSSTLVDTVLVSPGTLSPTLTLFGRVESPHTTTLSAATSAFVEQVAAYEGQAVTQDQLLVALDNTDAKLLLAQREADLSDVAAQTAQQENRHRSDLTALKIEQELLELANKKAGRYEKLVKKNVGSDTQRDDALQSAKRQALSVNSRKLSVQDHPSQLKRLQAQLQRAQALRDQAALDLARTQITAPFNGRVTAVHVSPRNRLRQGEPVITLYDSDHIEVRAQIPSRYLADIRTALENQIALKGYILIDNRRIPVVLDRVSGNVSENRGGVDGFFRFPETNPDIETGRAAELHLTLAAKDNTIALPPYALYGQNRIYQVTADNTLQAISIIRQGEAVQENGESWVLVSGNIEPDTRILITQLPNAISGLKVGVRNNDSP